MKIRETKLVFYSKAIIKSKYLAPNKPILKINQNEYHKAISDIVLLSTRKRLTFTSDFIKTESEKLSQAQTNIVYFSQLLRPPAKSPVKKTENTDHVICRNLNRIIR